MIPLPFDCPYRPTAFNQRNEAKQESVKNILMATLSTLMLFAASIMLMGTLQADVQVTTESSQSGSFFRFEAAPLPAIDDAGSKGKWKILSGQIDANSGAIDTLFDGRVPTGEDQPAQNFFFAGTHGGMIAVDLGQRLELSEIVTYSWHSDSRVPQVYSVYAATGDEQGFAFPESADSISKTAGWNKIADVDTRPKYRKGSQHVARIFEPQLPLGSFRHLLFAVNASEPNNAFSNTFFSEIDVIVGDAGTLQRISVPEVREIEFTTTDEFFRFTIDVTQALELEEWTETELKPAIQEWYPKIVTMLPSEGFEAARHVRFQYLRDAEMKGIPAYASGSTVSMNAEWFRGQLDREALGAVVHEMVHIVQGYPGRSRSTLGVTAPPGWIVEGIPDYIRWFHYEPQSGGAKLSTQALKSAKHDASYRISANFIDWVIRNYPLEGQCLQRLNAAARQGKYSSETWHELTGKSEKELAESWRAEP